MGLFITVLIAAFLPFVAVGVCVLSDICSGLPSTMAYYQRLYISWQVGCSLALVLLFLFRAVGVFRAELDSQSHAVAITNVCEQASSIP